jgi:hypothetical protein
MIVGGSPWHTLDFHIQLSKLGQTVCEADYDMLHWYWGQHYIVRKILKLSVRRKMQEYRHLKEQHRQVVLLSLMSSWTVLYTLWSLNRFAGQAVSHSPVYTPIVAQSKSRHIHVNIDLRLLCSLYMNVWVTKLRTMWVSNVQSHAC